MCDLVENLPKNNNNKLWPVLCEAQPYDDFSILWPNIGEFTLSGSGTVMMEGIGIRRSFSVSNYFTYG